MRNFTATLHLQQLHYVTNQQMLINKIYFLFQTLALIFCTNISEHSVPSSKVFIRQGRVTVHH